MAVFAVMEELIVVFPRWPLKTFKKTNKQTKLHNKSAKAFLLIIFFAEGGHVEERFVLKHFAEACRTLVKWNLFFFFF